jgi:hypothetical protein
MSKVIRNVAAWPKPVQRSLHPILAVFSIVYLTARSRAASAKSKIIRILSQRDSYRWRLQLLRRENALLRRRLESIPPQKRPHYAPEDRFAILQLMWLRNWSIKLTAKRLVLHPNTLCEWLRAFHGKRDPGLFFGAAPFNKISERVRWLVREIRRLCPEKEFGTRTIAMMIIRAGVQLSRSTVLRILRETNTRRPRPSEAPRNPVASYHILRPEAINRTWHLDMTTLEFAGIQRFYVAAIIDGFSRKLLALRVFSDAPNTSSLFTLFRSTVQRYGAPRFLVTDHGCQFWDQFTDALQRLNKSLSKHSCKDVIHTQGVDAKRFNGKVERFFRTFKVWKLMLVCAFGLGPIQRRLNVYQRWYNTQRPMLVLDGRTPDEAWRGVNLAPALATRENSPFKPAISVARTHFAGDLELPQLNIQIVRTVQRSA